MTVVWILLMAAAYPAVMIALVKLVQPCRRELFQLGETLLSDRRLKPEERKRITHMLDSAFAFRVCVLLPVAALSVMLDEILRRPVDRGLGDWLERDVRYHRMMALYFVSVAAANPFGAIIALPFMVSAFVVSVFMGLPAVAAAVEAPLLRASYGTLKPGAYA